MAIVRTLQGGTADSKKVCTSLAYSKRWPTTCCRPIKFVRDGVGYCGIHDPQRAQSTSQPADVRADQPLTES